MKYLVALIAFLLSVVVMANTRFKEEIQPRKSQSPPTALIPNQSSKSQHENYSLENVRKRRQEALEVRKSYIEPIFETIWSHPVNCTELEDNEEAFKKLKSIRENDQDPKDFLEFWNDRFHMQLPGNITPELEKSIQEGTIGHITSSYLNKTTVDAYAKIWEEYPCSEAAAVALLEIIPPYDYLGSVEDWNSECRSNMHEYIISNYPESWQTKVANIRDSIQKYGTYSKKTMEVLEANIYYYDKNNTYENRYYQYLSRSPDPKRRAFSSNYGFLAEIYGRRCEEIAKNGIDKNGEVPNEAIELYNKDFELWEMAQRKYPEYSDIIENSHDKYVNFHMHICEELIKEHAPSHYRGNQERKGQ